MINNPNYNPFYTDDAAISRYEKGKCRMIVDNREQMEDRFKPGGDKYESIKADEQWEKAHAAVDYFICDGCCEPKESTDACWDDGKLYCFECFDEKEKIVDISEGEECET